MSYTMQIIDGDLVVDSRGRVTTITSLDKIAQEVMETLLVRYDPPAVNIGSNFSLIIDQYIASARITTYVRSELMIAIERLKQVQSTQSPALPDDEVIEKIEDLVVRQTQPGVINLSFRVVARSGQSRVISTDVVVNSVTLETLE